MPKKNVRFIADQDLLFLVIRGRLINLTLLSYLFFKIRRLFPYFYYCSFFDCDSARYYSGQEFFSWNEKDLRKNRDALNRYSDGTKFRDIGLIHFLKIKFYRIKHNEKF